jgi:hypothetical protein
VTFHEVPPPDLFPSRHIDYRDREQDHTCSEGRLILYLDAGPLPAMVLATFGARELRQRA